MTSRRSLLAQIHVARKQLLITDERYWALLQSCGCPCVDGQYSAANLSLLQLQFVVTQLKTMGFTITAGQKTRRKNKPQVSKLYAIWSGLYRDGKVTQHGFLAMVGWCQRQLPELPSDINEASAFQLNQLIEAMKQWQTRTPV